MLERYRALDDGRPYDNSAESMARRSLKNVLLAYLAARPDGIELAERQLETSDNMTDTLAALRCLVDGQAGSAGKALAEFEQRWADDPLVMDKWFTLQAMVPGPETPANVRRLLGHPAFSIRNPNKVRALLGAFSMANPTGFHAGDGAGYALLADQVVELDGINPQIAARTVSAFNAWKRYDANRQSLMRQSLQRISQVDGLSGDVAEIVGNALAE
jgi:aminopeptidase N